MPIEFITAKPGEEKILSALRQRVWATTYRGIYPDEDIDNFDYPFHNEMDKMRIEREDFTVYFIEKDGEKIGYLVLQEKQPLYVQSLYLLEEFRGMGIGKLAFEQIKAYCKKHGHSRFYLGCHPQNERALGFYHKMGGVITARDEGHENNKENSVRFDFTVK